MKNKKKLRKTRVFNLISIFPGIFDSYLAESLFKRAIKKRIIKIKKIDLRDFAVGRKKSAASKEWSRRQVDDRPFGGGPGMVLMVEPIYRAVKSIKSNISATGKKKPKTRIILFSTRGKKLDSKTAKRLAGYDQLILICGRYEGVDERVARNIADEEISIGDYVLSGGELPALVLMEAVSRQVPGFLGKRESLEDLKGSYPVYTKPAKFLPSNQRNESSRNAWTVPPVLMSGNHKKIQQWRQKKQSL